MIALWRGLSPTSDLICLHTRSQYSHASWICDDGSNIEAWVDRMLPWPRGAVRHNATINEGHTPGTVVELYDFARRLNLVELAQIEAFLLNQIGKPYDFEALMGFASRRPQKTDERAWICSELIFAACQAAGIDLLSRVEPWAVSPRDIHISPLLVKAGEKKTK